MKAESEYQLIEDLAPDINLLKRSGTSVELTPLLIAIQYRHFDIARYIMEKMMIDIRYSLALISNDSERQHQRNLGSKNDYLDTSLSHTQLSIEELSYGLLVACANEDFDMLRYLWENFGTNFWELDHLKCIMKQLIHQGAENGINMIFESEVTHQIVKSMASKDRANFIEEYIGQPFYKDFDPEVRKCLIENFTQQPYAGSFLIILIEKFEEL